MVGAIRLIGIAFIQLVEVDDLRFPIGKAHIAKSCNGVGGGSVLEQAVAKKQAEIFRIIFCQTFLFVSQCKNGVRKIGFTIIADRVDVPCLRRIFLAVLLRRDSTHLHRSAEAVKVREARTQDLLHVGEGDGGKVQIFRRAILRDKQVGIADEIPLIGIDYFIVISVCSGKIIGDALLHILNALSENLIDRKGSLIHIFRNGCVVIEDRLPGCSGRSAIRQASKDNPRQEQNKKQRQRQ